MAKSRDRVRGFSLTFRLSLGFTLLLILLMGTVGFTTYVRERAALVDSVVGRGWSTLRLVNTVALEGLWSRNHLTLSRTLKDLRAEGTILDGVVVDKKGSVVAASGADTTIIADKVQSLDTDAGIQTQLTPIRDEAGKVTALLFSAPIEDSSNEALGYTFILSDLTFIDSYLEDTAHNLIVNFVLASIAGLLLARLIVMRAVGRPVKELLLATEKVAVGDFSYQLSVPTGDELGQLARAFNIMGRELALLFRTIREKVGDMGATSSTLAKRSETMMREGDGDDPPRRTELLKEIHSSSRRLARMCEQLNSLVLQFKTNS